MKKEDMNYDIMIDILSSIIEQYINDKYNSSNKDENTK